MAQPWALVDTHAEKNRDEKRDAGLVYMQPFTVLRTHLNYSKQRVARFKMLFSFGPILLFGGGLFLLDGARQLYQDYIQQTKWPAENALVQSCSVYETWDYAGTPSTKHALSKRSYVRCKIGLPGRDGERENTIKVGDAITTYDKHRQFLTSKLTIAKMQDWIARHPAGSLLSIHCDPSNPTNISVSGEDDDLRLATPYDRLWFGIFTFTGGLAIMIIGKLSQRNHG